MRRALLSAAVVLALGAAACASILGIEDGKLDPNAVDGGVVICESDSGVEVRSNELFVSADLGEDGAGCSEQAPCKTLGAAIDEFNKNAGTYSLVYIAQGTYPETLQLPAGLELQGGWHARGKNPSIEWHQVCQDRITDPTQVAHVVGSDNKTLVATDTGGESKVTTLFIDSRAAQPGESLYGLFASGSSTVTLTDVIFTVGPGGAGADGKPGDNGDDGSDASCPLGDGATPDPGTDGPGAGALTYAANGTQAGTPAGAGTPGSDGSNGVLAQDGGCATCLNCVVALGCGSPTGTKSCGKPGGIGCGGKAGAAGGPAQNGGSSIGVFVSGGAVVLQRGTVSVGNGGKGGVGGAGGAGGKGSLGATGDEGASCNLQCNGGCLSASTTGGGDGGEGSRGGNGSAGGSGGCGAGGDTFAFINLDASVTTDAAIQLGSAGSPGGAGAASGKQGTFGP